MSNIYALAGQIRPAPEHSRGGEGALTQSCPLVVIEEGSGRQGARRRLWIPPVAVCSSRHLVLRTTDLGEITTATMTPDPGRPVATGMPYCMVASGTSY